MSNRWMIDFDDTIADLHGAFIRCTNERFGTAYTMRDVTSWNHFREQPKEIGDFIWTTCYPDADWFLAEVQPLPGAIDALVDLITNIDGIADDVKIVTARHPDLTPMAAEWLERHLPDGVNVTVISSPKRKALVCRDYDLNVVVEDGPHNLAQMNAYRQRLFLVDCPWNADVLLAKVTRVGGLPEAVRIVAQGKEDSPQ
jgi:5'(3')-deoxyribonucleotidase